MKKGIHPNWQDCTVTCACGESFQTKSTFPTLQVDICSQCHPFFTGEMKFVDTQGRVDLFMQKMKKAQATKAAKSQKKTKTSDDTQTSDDQKSYKQILQEQKSALKQSAKAA